MKSDPINLETLLQELGPRFAEKAAAQEDADAFVAENYDILRERRVFSALVPTELGGGGARHSDMCAFLAGLAHYCASTALALSMHQHLIAAAVVNSRSGRPGKKLLERVAAEEAVLISTGANDWMESSGTAERVAGGFCISATKPFCSGSPKGSVLVTSAPYKDPQEGWQILHFPVPFSCEGISLANDWRTLGMRATGSQTVILDSVFVPEEMVVLRRPRGEYHSVWSVILTAAVPLIMSVYIGIAEAAAEIARSHAAKRTSDPVAPYLLGEMINLLTTAQLALEDMVRITNNMEFKSSIKNADAMLVRKTIAANAVLATVEKALEATGGAGFYRRLGLERLLRDVHGAQFHPLPEKRQQLFTGRLALGLNPVGGTSNNKVPSDPE